MQFVPVTGSDLKRFDAETIQLYRKRESDPRYTEKLLTLDRNVDRNFLPIMANPLTEWQKDRQRYLSMFVPNTICFLAFSYFAQRQFSKGYFPYGIILRRSIPTTPMQQVSYRAPLALLFLFLWYRQREYPRSQRIDLTDDSEN